MKMHVFKIRLYVENLGHGSIHFSHKINGLYPEFNKKNNPLIFDIEVHVDFRLEVKKSIDPEGSSTKSRLLGKIGDFKQFHELILAHYCYKWS